MGQFSIMEITSLLCYRHLWEDLITANDLYLLPEMSIFYENILLAHSVKRSQTLRNHTYALGSTVLLLFIFRQTIPVLLKESLDVSSSIVLPKEWSGSWPCFPTVVTLEKTTTSVAGNLTAHLYTASPHTYVELQY